MSQVYTEKDVRGWHNESVAGWLVVQGVSSETIELFHGNDIDGAQLLEIDDDILKEMEISASDSKKILEGIAGIKSAKASSTNNDDDDWHSDTDDESLSSSSSSLPKRASATSITSSSSKISISKKNDPLRVAARSKAVADLQDCSVCSGWLLKTGGGKLKSWKKRYFVLTDDNCLYYFKSPKEMSALGMVLLPSYTITPTMKSDGVSKAHSFKAFNREQSKSRTYFFAAETEQEMKTWMNVMSLASIAFGSGKASTKEHGETPELMTEEHKVEMEVMQMKATDRAGGVTGTNEHVLLGSGRLRAPSFVTKAAQKRGNKGPVMCFIKLLDGQALQLPAESSTTGKDFMDQIGTMLKAYERYYFGLMFYDNKGDPDWVDLDKKLLKQEIPRKDDGHLELEFRIRFYPVDVTQVLQYVTLYQTFLAARHAIISGQLRINNKDAFMLASLALQATLGDYDESRHTPDSISHEALIPEANKDDIVATSSIKVENLGTFFAEEVIRVWKSLRGILRHLAVLKYMQLAQKHPQFATQYFDIKNKNGTPLTLGVSPRGLFVYRIGALIRPVVTFSWAECSELSFTDKKFTIQVHDKGTKPFSVYASRSKSCQQILDLCIGLHRLYVQAFQKWANPPQDIRELRTEAVQAALAEREQLKKESQEARKKAKKLKRDSKNLEPSEPAPEPTPEPSSEATPSEPAEEQPAKEETFEGDTGEKVVVKGRQEAVAMLDLMMADEDFMKFQDEFMEDFEREMMEELEQGGRLRSASFVGGPRRQDDEDVQVCSSQGLNERVQYIQDINVA